MKILVTNIFIYFLIIILISSCKHISLGNCQCTELEIYGFPNNILTPIRILKDSVMENEVQIISNRNSIDAMLTEIEKMEKIEALDGIDNRFVIKAICQNSSDIIIESNNYVTKIGNSYFKPSSEFLNLVSNYTSKIDLNNCKCQLVNLIVNKKQFQISDSIKIRTLKDELKNLKPIKDDGRVIFGDTIIFNCNSNSSLMVLINEDYIKLNNQKYKPRPKLRKILRKYKGDEYVYNAIKQALLNKDSTTKLSLRDCSLESIPPEIFELQNLEFLDLSLNIIKEIPDEIYKLKKLKRLGVSYNLIDKVSPNISQLYNLENIWFLDNRLKKIPDGICDLKNLKELNITGNPIIKLPNCIPKMKSLENFYFGTFSDTTHSESILKQIELFKKMNKELNIRI